MSASSESGTVVTLPVARDAEPSGLAALLAEVRAVAVEGPDPTATEQAFDADAELAAQDLALAGESAQMRARAERYAAAVEAGASLEPGAIESVLRAFRSYQPMLGVRDRRLNAAAYRRLAAATAPAHRQVA